MWQACSKRYESHTHGLYEDHAWSEAEDAACRKGNGQSGEFRSVFATDGRGNEAAAAGEAAGWHREALGISRLPSAFNPMPRLTDLRACMERCRACGSRCRAVSVSSQRSACIWYAPRPQAPSVCEDVGDGAAGATLRTAWPRPYGWRPPTNLSWEKHQRLDDFVTVEGHES